MQLEQTKWYARVRAGQGEPGSQRWLADITFIEQHWTPHPDGTGGYRCDMWDPTTRLCTAHDGRPAICRDFPWYGQPPDERRLATLDRCSYWEDVPIEDRPKSLLSFSV